MNAYLFFRGESFYPVDLADDAAAVRDAENNPGTTKVENAVTRKVVWQYQPKLKEFFFSVVGIDADEIRNTFGSVTVPCDEYARRAAVGAFHGIYPGCKINLVSVRERSVLPLQEAKF